MFPIDIRTLYLSIIVIHVFNLVLISTLCFQIKKRFPGTILILVSFFISTIGNILVYLRNSIPDWISIIVANLLIVFSLLVLIIAFEKFVKKKSSQVQNYILLLIFLLIHSYFTLVTPDIHFRRINISVVYVLFSLQIVYLMLKRTPKLMRKITLPVGLVFLAVCVIQIIRVFYLLLYDQASTAIFKSNSIEVLFLLTWQVIVIFLAYSISLMYNSRLINEIKGQEEKYSKAFHAAPFIITLTKVSDGKIFEVNDSVLAFSGYQPKDLIGFTSSELNIWEHNENRLIFIDDLKSNRVVVEKEYNFRKKSGELFPGLVYAEIITINNEQCIISIIKDISNRKKAEYNLKNSEASLRELNATKDKFFSIIAHDLRTPFNGIIGFSEILSQQVKDKDYEGIQEYAEIINSSSRHAMNLLSNLMEWSLSQTGGLVYNPIQIDVVQLIKSTLELLKTSSEHKLISVTLNTPSKLVIHADKAMIEVILRNLISNAIKFTPQSGTISITAEEKENTHLISIIDSGIGINNSSLEKLFKIDSTYSTPGTNNEVGTGLGLILCKDFIDYHKGKIWAESELGVGSSFYFSIPVNKDV